MAMLTNTRTLRIEWGDCDPAGIVFYPRYFAIFDSCTTALFERAVGMTKYEFIKVHDVIGYPLVDARARFIIPSKFRDEVTIETSIGEFRRSSFTVNHRILKDGALAVEGIETRVWTGRDPDDPERMKSKPIPREIIARFTTG
jgi:4-hydroxybenzoyl-CoA thioesterase